MIKQHLKQPYPQLAKRWKMIITISLFIAAFLLFFQPFGLSEYKSNFKALILIGYGGVTFVILVINFIVIRRVFKKWFANWTILKQSLWLSWIIFTIGTGNYFYSSIIFSDIFGVLGVKGFFVFQLFTLIVGVFPVVTVTLVLHNIKLSHNLKVAGEISNLLIAKPNGSQTEQTVVLVADNNKDKVEVELSRLLYIESVGNYIQIAYYQDSKVVKTLLRGAIKRIESETVQYPSLVKCHRAFIVNINQVESVKGNSQELILSLKNIDAEIPVSRNHAQKIKNSLR